MSTYHLKVKHINASLLVSSKEEKDGSENIKWIKILDRRNSYVPKKVFHFTNYKINCINSTVPYTLAQHLLNLTIWLQDSLNTQKFLKNLHANWLKTKTGLR